MKKAVVMLGLLLTFGVFFGIPTATVYAGGIDQGNHGNQGNYGNYGNQGDKDKGDKGNNGNQGNQGNQGDYYYDGYQGDKGDKGDKGKDPSTCAVPEPASVALLAMGLLGLAAFKLRKQFA